MVSNKKPVSNNTTLTNTALLDFRKVMWLLTTATIVTREKTIDYNYKLKTIHFINMVRMSNKNSKVVNKALKGI